MNSVVEMSGALLQVPQGEFELVRQPRDTRLQAWDAADEYLLGYIDERDLCPGPLRILILNDQFGALSVALADKSPYAWNDSLMSQIALRNNLRLNGYPEDQVRTNSGIDFPVGEVDLVLFKVPKSLALLEHQLYALRAVLHHDSLVIGAGLARHIHRSTLERLETILGPTSTTRARKKSRLIFVDRDQSLNQGQSPYPDYYQLHLGRDFELINHASLFSRDRLDPGTRLLLEHMPVDPELKRIVDLGCGNGVVGIVAAEMNPTASLLFCDESHMAVASAEQNFRNAFGRTRDAEFCVRDCLQGVESESADLVLLNPPFHQHHGVGDAIAWRMFKEARQVLRPGGEIRVVGNRHLGYHAKMKKLFGNCETVVGNNKFVILSALKH